MPKRRADDVVHVMTDHTIQRVRPARDLLAEFKETPHTDYHGEVGGYYPQKADELYLAVAQAQHGSNLESGIARLRNAIEKNKPDQAEFYL